MANNVMRVPVRGSGSSMPEYGARTQTAVAGAGASARLDDGAAGIALSGNWKERNWKDLFNLGQAVEGAGIAGHQLYMDYQQTRAKEAYNAYQREAMQEKARLNDLKGRDAIGEHGVQAQLGKWQETTRQRLLKDLGEPAQILFGKMADNEDAELNAWGINKGASEFRAYQNTVDEGRILTAQQQAMEDPAQLAKHMGVIRATYYDMGRRNGWDTEYTKARFEQVQQKTVADMVTTAIEGEQLGQARALLGQYGGLLGPARKGIEARLNAKGRELENRARVQADRFRKQNAINMAQELVAQGADAEGAQAYMAANISDPETLYLAQQSYLSLVAMNEKMSARVIEEENRQRYQSAVDAINSKDATPQQMSAAIMLAPPDEQEKLKRLANKRLAGSNFLSDAVKLQEMQAAIIDGKYNGQDGVQQLENDYGPFVSNKDIAEARKTLHTMSEKAAGSALKPIFDTELAKWGDAINDFASDKDLTKQQAQKAIYDIFAAKCYELGLYTKREQLEYMKTFLREIHFKRERFLLPDKVDEKIPAFMVPDALKQEGVTLLIPEADRKSIKAQLEANGYAASDANILKVYQENRMKGL